MRSWFETFRKNWKAWAYAVLGALALAAFVEFHTGFLEETGWSARQIGAKGTTGRGYALRRPSCQSLRPGIPSEPVKKR